jgi:hypothetical protein
MLPLRRWAANGESLFSLILHHKLSSVFMTLLQKQLKTAPPGGAAAIPLKFSIYRTISGVKTVDFKIPSTAIPEILSRFRQTAR